MASTAIVWVYGASAAGKETFIHKILSGDSTLLQKFGWQEKRIGVCEESLRWVAQFPNDPIAEQERHRLQEIIPRLAEHYDVVLIKGQDKDLALGTPMQVKRSLPDAAHHIIFIDVGLDELFQRVLHKPWWDDLITRAEEEGWLEEQIDRLTEMQNEFQFTAIDGRAIGQYEEEDFGGNFV